MLCLRLTKYIFSSNALVEQQKIVFLVKFKPEEPKLGAAQQSHHYREIKKRYSSWSTIKEKQELTGKGRPEMLTAIEKIPLAVTGIRLKYMFSQA